MARMIIGVSLPEDVARWVETHWEKGKVSGNVVDLIRVYMRGAGTPSLPVKDPNDFSKLNDTQRLSIAVQSAKPYSDKYSRNEISQPAFFDAVRQISAKLRVNERTVMAALPRTVR